MSVRKFRPGQLLTGQRRAVTLDGFFHGDGGIVPVTIRNTRALIERLSHVSR